MACGQESNAFGQAYRNEAKGCPRKNVCNGDEQDTQRVLRKETSRNQGLRLRPIHELKQDRMGRLDLAESSRWHGLGCRDLVYILACSIRYLSARTAFA